MRAIPAGAVGLFCGLLFILLVPREFVDGVMGVRMNGQVSFLYGFFVGYIAFHLDIAVRAVLGVRRNRRLRARLAASDRFFFSRGV